MQLQPSDALPKIMLARYYSNSLSRFLSTDPLSSFGRNLRNAQRWNRYGYTLNNPLRYFDPNGEAEVEMTFRAFIRQESVGIFRGDNRGFSADRNASSRTSVTVRVETDPAKRKGPSAQVARPEVKIGASQTTFSSGTRTATGPMLPMVNTHSDSGGNTVVDIHQDVKIPYPVPTEGIQAGVSITIPQDASSISISGTISGSPSFEVNVSVDGGPVQNIPLQEESENDVVFGAKLQTTNEVQTTKELKKEEKK